MQRFLVLSYGIACYGAFLIVFLYAIGFVTNFRVSNFALPKSIDDGPRSELVVSFLIDGLLVALFAVQHSVMARPAFKRVWTRVVPTAAERSTYILFTSLALIILFWQWRPLPQVVWNLESPAFCALLWAINACGWGIVLASTFLIDHFELSGLRQVFLNFTKQSDQPGRLQKVGLYRLVRHPLMTGFLIAFWATPTMSIGHLFFAATMTAYILVAVQIEERLADPFRRRIPKLSGRSWHAGSDVQTDEPSLSFRVERNTGRDPMQVHIFQVAKRRTICDLRGEPGEEGEGQMHHLLLKSASFGAALGLVLVSSGCGRQSEGGSQASAPPVTVAYPIEKETTNYEDYTGRTAAIDSVQVTARVTGYLDKILFREGDEVKEGTVLYEIDPRPV